MQFIHFLKLLTYKNFYKIETKEYGYLTFTTTVFALYQRKNLFPNADYFIALLIHLIVTNANCDNFNK